MFDQTSVEGAGGVVGGDAGLPAWMRLHGEMKSATRRRCAWDAEHARHLREAEAMQLWVHFGYVSILEYLEREHGVEPRAACDRLRVSHALGELPMLEAELEDGTFQYSHVKELTRVVTPETEEEWIEATKGKTCGEVQAMVSGHKKGDGPRDPGDPDLRLRRFTVELPPQVITMYRELCAEIEAELGHRIEEADLFRIMVERARVSPEGASTRAQISICSHCDRGWQSGTGGRAELEPTEIERVLCDAEHLGSVDAEPGRKQATLSDKKRARIIARHGHRCAVPGCRSKRHIEVHHIDHRADGGGHEDWNLVPLCFGHHAAHHRGHLAIEGRAPDAIRFTWTAQVFGGRNESEHAHGATNWKQHAHAGANERQRAHGSANVGQRAHAGASEHRAAPKAARPSKFAAVVVRTQAREALVGLGWKIAIAGAAVNEACAQLGTDVSIDVLIREALRRCPRPTS